MRGALRFGANMGLSRLHCDGCGEERLHYKGRCVSCKEDPRGTKQNARTYKPNSWGEFQVKSRANR